MSSPVLPVAAPAASPAASPAVSPAAEDCAGACCAGGEEAGDCSWAGGAEGVAPAASPGGSLLAIVGELQSDDTRLSRTSNVGGGTWPGSGNPQGHD